MAKVLVHYTDFNSYAGTFETLSPDRRYRRFTSADDNYRKERKCRTDLRRRLDGHTGNKELAASRKTSINKLYEEFSIMALTAFDAENHFKAMAGNGSKKRGLELLGKIQNHYGDERKSISTKSSLLYM